MKESHKLEIKKKNDYLWITFPSVISVENKRRIQSRIEDKLSDGNSNIVIDFCMTRSIYSLTISLLIKLRNKTIDSGGTFHLVNISKSCFLQFKSVNLDSVLNIYPTEQDFLDAVGKDSTSE